MKPRTQVDPFSQKRLGEIAAPVAEDARVSEIRARLAAAEQVISDLNHCKRQWLMSIPARPDYDPDLVITASLRDVDALLDRVASLTEQVEELKGERETYRKAWNRSDEQIVTLTADNARLVAEKDELKTQAINMAAEIRAAQRAEDFAKHDRTILRRERDGEVWVWQNNEDDHLESLACPILIEPEELRELLASPTRAAGIREAAAVARSFGNLTVEASILALLTPPPQPETK